MKFFQLIALVMIFSLLSISTSCIGKADKNNDVSAKLIEQSFDNFNNRPIYTVLTEQIIDSIYDENLIQAIYDNLSKKCPDNYNKEYTTVMSWNKSRQAIFIIWWLEAEVNNGGFNQFYFNQSGNYYKQLPFALQSVGAIKFANLVQKANNIYEQEKLKQKISSKQNISLEEFIDSYENNPLNELDNAFYSLYNDENLSSLLVNFIRKNKVDFIDT